MLSLEAKRLKFRWRILATALVIALGGIVMFPNIAYATVYTGPDDGAGNYAHCNLSVFMVTVPNNTPIRDLACQYSLGLNGTAPGTTVSDVSLNATWTCTGSPCAGGTNPSLTFGAGCVVNSAGHAEWYKNQGTCGSFTVAANTIATYVVNSCSVTLSTGGGARPCVIDNVSIGTQAPPLPASYYSGSSAGPALDATTGTVACSRTLTDTSAMTGSFTAVLNPTNATATTHSWVWGDATTNGTTTTQNHTYGALSTMPTGGWTATLTETFTSTSGHLFASGSSTATATCSLRVDFLHPDKTVPASNDTSSTGDSGLDACLPSGWSVLNPLAWVGGIGCVLKYLFIPQSSTITALGHTWDTATTKLPFSIVYDAVTYIPQQLDDFKYAINLSPSSAAFFCQGTWGSYFCNGAHTTPFYGTDFGGGTGGHTTPATVAVTRNVVLFLIIVVFVYSCWRGAGEILK